MGINDYGKEVDDNLAAPPLGGPGGWAEAVAKALNDSDVPVNTRIDAEVAELGTQVLFLAGGDVIGPTTVEGLHVGNVWGTYHGIQSETNAPGSEGGGSAILLPKVGMTPNAFVVGGVNGTVHLRGNGATASSGTDVVVEADGQLNVPGMAIGPEAMASGWTTGSTVIMKRSGMVTIKFYNTKKSTTPATGDTMFTVPAGFRPHASLGTIYFAIIANSAIAGSADGLKSYLASIENSGACKIGGSNVPAANVNLYGFVSYPVD